MSEKKKIKFILVGSGWRALYYVRVAKAMPDLFELTAMYCRSEEKARLIAEMYQIHTTTSKEECVDLAPDLVVVTVSKASIAEVSVEWMKKGFTVVCETPAGLDVKTLNKLWEMHEKGHKLVVAEQYAKYPWYAALLKVVEQNKIGEPDCLNISLAHSYHGASLMRAFLQIPVDMGFSVSAKVYKFPTVETLTRYEYYKDGRTADKQRTAATFEFENGRVAFYDFDTEQYRSPIRKNTVRLQGWRGELIDNRIYYLDEEQEPHEEEITIETRTVDRGDDNPNFKTVEEVTSVQFEGQTLYVPEFGLCGLTQDETAVAGILRRSAEYAWNQGDAPYELKEALQDAYMAILLQEAIESGQSVRSTRQKWH